MPTPPTIESCPPPDDQDSPIYMLLRREFSNLYAAQGVDFYIESLRAAESLTGVRFGPSDVVVDTGSNNGRMAAEAAQATGLQARLVCVEPSFEAQAAYRDLPPILRNRIGLFVRGKGEATPLQGNLVACALLHNVIFRADDPFSVLAEQKRIVRPGGYIAVSSNMQGHAPRRHGFESMVAEEVKRRLGIPLNIPKPPAEGQYIENMPGLVRRVGGLEIVKAVYQVTKTVITPQRVDPYLMSIKFSAANTELPVEHRRLWRQVVESLVRPTVEAEIELSRQRGEENPHFSDPVKRGMLMLRVLGTA